MLPYSRALDPADYEHPDLAAHAQAVRRHMDETHAAGMPVRLDHAHRVWEYANIVRQLACLAAYGARVHDAGFGGSCLAPLLAARGYAVSVSDQRYYPAPRGVHAAVAPLDRLPFDDGAFDATVSVSVIEHVPRVAFVAALRELVRVTRHGGLVMLTSDFFREGDVSQLAASPWRADQETAFTPLLAAALPALAGAAFVGPTDFAYRGDFVHNYSFVNFCLRREA